MTLQPLLGAGWMNAVLPELVLCVGGMLLMLVAAFAPRAKGISAPLTIILLIAAWCREPVRYGDCFAHTYEISVIPFLFDSDFRLAALLATRFSRESLEREGNEG